MPLLGKAGFGPGLHNVRYVKAFSPRRAGTRARYDKAALSDSNVSKRRAPHGGGRGFCVCGLP